MQENRMFSDVKLAKRLTPAWLSPFFAFFTMIVGQIVGAIVMAFSAALAAVPYFLANPQLTDRLSNPSNMQELFGDYYLLLSLFSFVFIAGLFLLWVKFFEQRPIITLGFYKDNWKKELLKGFGLGILLFSVVMLILILTGSYQLVGTTFTPYAFGFVLLTIPFWLIQGGTEELITRGWLLPVMAEKSNKNYCNRGFEQSIWSSPYVQQWLYYAIPDRPNSFWRLGNVLHHQNRQSLGSCWHSWSLELCSGQHLWSSGKR